MKGKRETQRKAEREKKRKKDREKPRRFARTKSATVLLFFSPSPAASSLYYVSGPAPPSHPDLLLRHLSFSPFHSPRVHPSRSSGWFCGARAKHVFCQFLLFPV